MGGPPAWELGEVLACVSEFISSFTPSPQVERNR